MNISSASRWLTVYFSILMLSPPVWAESVSQPLFPVIGMDAGGSLRLRYEWKQGFALGTPGAIDPQDYLLSQLRLHLNIHKGDHWHLFFEGQDSRVNSMFLRNTVNDVKATNTFADRFDLHQGYLDARAGNDFAIRIKVGRQKFNLGAQRLVASLEWVNTARVWDAVRISQQLGDKRRSLDMFASRLVPVRPRTFNTHALTGNRMFDSQFYGIYLTDKASIPHSRAEFIICCAATSMPAIWSIPPGCAMHTETTNGMLMEKPCCKQAATVFCAIAPMLRISAPG